MNSTLQQLTKIVRQPTGGFALILLIGLLLWLAPDERVLGNGIKVVYLHVSLIWAGMTGLVILGILGLIQLIRPNQALQAWGQDLGWVAFGFFLAGIGMSMVAAWVNWGGIFQQEPRTVAMLRVVAVALIVQILTGWPIPLRLKGGLWAGLALFLTWSVWHTALVLHPRNPIQSSSSVMIQATFFGLFALACLLMLWLVLRWQIGQQASEPTPSVSKY